ncbi:MAG TPA: beta-propeller fold lactonase family protein [Planctomycetota bacterium]|jgi:YVTN family beta-propeller protein|nr:beta-propeller fold lactonase family protein [Planctomycetota bacterium]
MIAALVLQSLSAAAQPAPVETRFDRPRPVGHRQVGDRNEFTTQTAFLSCNNVPDGDGPHELAILPNGSAVVIVHKNSNALTFFDVNTRTATDTVTVHNLPVQVAVTPNGQYALAPCVFTNDVAVVDVATRTLVTAIPVTGQQPYKVLVTPDSHWAVVGVINDGVTSAFSILDLTTLTEVATIPTGPQGLIGFWFSPESGRDGYIFTSFALSPDGTTIVLPDRGGSRVLLYDRIAAGEVANLATAANPSGVDVSLDGQVAVVTHEFGVQALTKIDLVTRTVSGSFATPNDFTDRLVRITPDKSHAIAAISNNVVFVNLTTGATAATLSTGSVGDIEISFDGQYAFISNFNSSVIDISTRTIVKTLTLAPTVEAVVSPVALRAVALNSRFKEDVHVYDIHGAAGFVEGFAPSGPPPEGDASRSIAVSRDGTLAVVGNDLSRNVCVLDLLAGTVRAWIPTGDRVLGVAISPDNHTALVCNADSDTVSVVDLATDTVVATLAVPQRPVDVRISPDSQSAYVNTVAGSDRIYFLHLAGAASSVVGSILGGQMGSAQGYAYTGLSGIELSPNGAILAACASFDNQLQLIDTATRTEIVRVPVGNFPYQVAFKPDGTRAYVINAFGDSVSVVNIAGAGSSTIATVSGIDFPATVDVDAAGAFVYVANDGTSPGVRVISTATNTVVATVALTGETARSAHLSQTDHVLYVASGNSAGGTLARVNAAGAGSSIIDFTPLSSSPAEMGFSEALREAVVAQPVADGVDLARFGVPETYCTGAANSAGPGARIGWSGFTSIALNQFTLEVSGSPPLKGGFFFYGNAQAQVPFGDGVRCVGGTLGRLRPVTLSDGTGHNSRHLDFTVPPASSGPAQIVAGSTWYFTYWYRDPFGPLGSGTNLSDGLAVVFPP